MCILSCSDNVIALNYAFLTLISNLSTTGYVHVPLTYWAILPKSCAPRIGVSDKSITNCALYKMSSSHLSHCFNKCFIWKNICAQVQCSNVHLVVITDSHNCFTWALNMVNDTHTHTHTHTHTSSHPLQTSCENTRSLNVVRKWTLVIPVICVTFTNSWCEMNKSPVFVQVHCSHNVASIQKWQMSVKYATRGNIN
jgi:hypothetical protein